MYIRHGDLILEKIEDSLKGKSMKKTSFALARGEFTGHSHIITSSAPMVLYGDEMQEDTVRYLVVKAPAQIVHQEHKKLDIPIGKYKVYKEREYSYFEHTINAQKD